jgi:hypothetical protein
MSRPFANAHRSVYYNQINLEQLLCVAVILVGRYHGHVVISQQQTFLLCATTWITTRFSSMTSPSQRLKHNRQGRNLETVGGWMALQAREAAVQLSLVAAGTTQRRSCPARWRITKASLAECFVKSVHVALLRIGVCRAGDDFARSLTN